MGANPIGPSVLQNGPFAGWTTWSNGADPYETAIGPFAFREIDGRVQAAFEPCSHHLNGGGAVHGGALMSFADFSLFAIAHKTLAGSSAVTLTCNCEFLGAAGPGDRVQAEGDVLRETGSFVFVRGVARQSDRPILAFSGTLRKIARRA